MKTPPPDPGAMKLLGKLLCLHWVLDRLEERDDRRFRPRLRSRARPSRVTRNNLEWFLRRES